LKLKHLVDFALAWGHEKGGLKNGAPLLQVIENTYSKNARFSPLHDVHENKRVKPFSPRR
jgi:hypothetical protein